MDEPSLFRAYLVGLHYFLLQFGMLQFWHELVSFFPSPSPHFASPNFGFLFGRSIKSHWLAVGLRVAPTTSSTVKNQLEWWRVERVDSIIGWNTLTMGITAKKRNSSYTDPKSSGRYKFSRSVAVSCITLDFMEMEVQNYKFGMHYTMHRVSSSPS